MWQRMLQLGSGGEPTGRKLTEGIPIMTSNNNPSGLASSSDLSANAYNAFRDSHDNYIAISSGTTKYVQYIFDEYVMINALYTKKLMQDDSSSKTYDIMISKDGKTFEKINAITISAGTDGEYLHSVNLGNYTVKGIRVSTESSIITYFGGINVKYVEY